MGKLFTAFADFLARLFGKNIGFFADVISRKVAMTVALVGLLVTMMATVYTAITAIIAGLTYVMPDFMITAATWVIPDNLNECVFAYITSETVFAVYRWQKEQIKTARYIT